MTEEKLERHWSYLPPRDFSTMNPIEYIEERINQLRKWYDFKAVKAKKTYLGMRSFTVIGGALVPVLINLPSFKGMDWITTFISLVVIVLVSLESVFHYREQWKNYRSTEQFLAKEYFNFTTGEGPYKEMEKNDAFMEFVDRVENTIASENASTLNVMTTLTESKASGE